MNQVKERIDFVVSPVGGGSFCAGTCCAAHYLSPHTKVVGVEPEQKNDGFKSITTHVH
jgi:threonine dehydratase